MNWPAKLVLTLWAASILCAHAQVPIPPGDPPILLTNAQQIADLSNNIPAGRYAARFQAVVIYVSPSSRRLYVQEDKFGVQVSVKTSVTPYHVGHRVEVNGVVGGGEPGLRLTNATATVLGDALLPEPPLISIHNLVRGEERFRYVRTRGIVRDMYTTASQFTLLLTEGNYPFEAWFQTDNLPLPRELMDAEIEVTGHSFPFYSPAAGRATGIRFHATDTNNLRVLKPGLAERFAGRPLLTIAEAARLPNDLGPRYRVAGTVTVHRPGIAFFLDDGTGVMHVDQSMHFLNAPPDAQRLEREPQTRLEPGDRVEVIGARFNFFSIAPSLQATEFRRLGRGPVPPPVAVTVPDLREGRYAGRLVTVTARIIDQRIWGNSILKHNMDMVLRDEDNMFSAHWEGDAPVEWSVPAGGYVRVTGVNEAEGTAQRKRSTFKLLLRSPADVVSAPEPPWWTRREVQRVALAAGVVGLLAGAWILLQRWQLRRLERRVADRTAELARMASVASAGEARTRLIVDTALDAVVSMDATGRITAWNARAEAIFGWPAAEVLGRSLAETIIPLAQRDAHRQGLERYLATGEGPVLNRRIEVNALHRDGREFPAELSIAPLRIEGAPHFSAFLRDITDRKRVEAELLHNYAREKELNELKSRFVAMVSHEFRTPLGIITSSAEILDAYLDRLSAEERRSNLRDITDSTRHMSHLMEEVLLLGRVEAGKMTCKPAPLDLAVFGPRLVEEVNSANGSRCRIQFEAKPGLPEARADEGLLRHIFINLLDNAAKYSPPGSTVEFSLEVRGHLALFTVRDRGIGIPDADVRLLFQAFHRGRNVGEIPGTGLGMTIVKRCVELHGGRIAFESREGQGTTFLVALPLFGPTPAGGGEHTTQFLRTAGGPHLTIVP